MLRAMAPEGSMICPNCGKLIGVAEERCPFCGAWRPGMFGAAPKLQRMFGANRLDLIPVIVTACVALYATSLALDPRAIFANGFNLFNLLAPSTRALYQLGMTGGVAWRAGWWWTLFTAIFLHGSLLHIFFNMMWTRDLGPVVTQAYGPARAFVIFMVAGAVGFLVSNLATGGPTIGASGSIFGLLAALIVFARRTGASMMKAQLWQWAIILFAFGFFMSGVNNFAHAGGFAGGWVSAQIMKPLGEKRETPAVQVLALVLLAVTAIGVVLSFVKVTALLMNP
jgi:rhomboid protease GluP